MSYSSYVLIVGLWGGPFLTHVYGYGLTARGDLLMLPAISHIVGVVVWGHAERVLGAYKPLVLAGALATAAALAAARRRSASSEPFWLAVWLAVFGFLRRLSSGADRARPLVPAAASGRARHDAVQYRHHGRDVRGAAVERRADRSVSGAGRRLSARCLSACSPRRRWAFWLACAAYVRCGASGCCAGNPPGRIKDFPVIPSCILCAAVYVIAARYVICVAYRRPPWAFPP